MARRALTDYLQVYPFWLFEVPRAKALADIAVLNPLSGFSAITMPEISLDMHEVVDGTSLFNRQVVKRGSVGTVTLSRGAKFADDDFYRWIRHAHEGIPAQKVSFVSPRKNLVLLHFFSRTSPADVKQDILGGFATLDLALRVPARAFYLSGCIPVRYKAGGDFDAASSEISIQEIEVAPDWVVQVSLGKGLVFS